jgi:hypothetical protein
MAIIQWFVKEIFGLNESLDFDIFFTHTEGRLILVWRFCKSMSVNEVQGNILFIRMILIRFCYVGHKGFCVMVFFPINSNPIITR